MFYAKNCIFDRQNFYGDQPSLWIPLVFSLLLEVGMLEPLEQRTIVSIVVKADTVVYFVNADT